MFKLISEIKTKLRLELFLQMEAKGILKFQQWPGSKWTWKEICQRFKFLSQNGTKRKAQISFVKWNQREYLKLFYKGYWKRYVDLFNNRKHINYSNFFKNIKSRKIVKFLIQTKSNYNASSFPFTNGIK